MIKSPRWQSGNRNLQSEIMFVIGTLQVGGSEMHLRQITPELVARGWAVSICSLSGDGPLRQQLEERGVTVHLPPVERNSKMGTVTRITKLTIVSAYLLGLFIRRRPKVVHFILPRAYLMGAPLALLARLPVRVMSRRSLNKYQEAHPILRRMERFLHGTMAAVLGNSLSVIRDLREEGVPDARLGLIYNGIEMVDGRSPFVKLEVRRSLEIASECLVFCIVANLIPYKGHLDLLNALALAAPHLPERWRLLVVGRDDGIGQELRRRAADLGIADQVFFLGARSDVWSLLAASDIGLSCSHEEGFSNAILESMAGGLPMVVTDVGGNLEAVVDGETGLAVPPHDPTRLAEAIVRLANDPDLRAKFGRRGYDRVLQKFSLQRCVEQYDALYRGLLAGNLPADVLEPC